MTNEAVRLLFDPFVVRSDSPSEYGINLMACYFIVHHHGGRIEAKSEEGRGTTFTMRLPLNPASTALSAPGEQELFHKLVLNDNLWRNLISTE
jgi:signal transduction histidine kinase